MSRVFAVWGDPIEHSKSPAMHNAAFAQLGLEHTYQRFRVSPDNLADALRGALAMGFGGVNLTLPLKRVGMEHVDRSSRAAQRIGAINTVAFARGTCVGHNTDGVGFLRGVQRLLPDLPGRAVVLGGGGAARAVVCGLLDAGVNVAWCTRDPRALPEWEGVHPCAYPELSALLEGAMLLVNATTVGMKGGPQHFPVEPPLTAMSPCGVVVDLVYGVSSRAEGSLLGRAEALGLGVQDGHEMLLGQGVASLELWLGRPLGAETLAAMRGALRI